MGERNQNSPKKIVKGVAQPGLEQIAEEQLGSKGGVEQVYHTEGGDGVTQKLSVGTGCPAAAEENQQQTHSIQHPKGGEPGDVFPEKGFVKEGYS